MNNIASEPRETLKDIISRNGEEILQDTDRCEGLLKDHCGLHRREIAALVGALEERIPVELKSSWQSAMEPEAMRARLVQRMQDNRGLAPELAGWAVDTWSYALGVGLGRRSDRLDSVVISEPKPEPVPVVNPVMAQEFGNGAFVNPQHGSQPKQAVQPEALVEPQTATSGQGSSQKKAVAVVAAAVALYFGYTHMPHPGPNQVCSEGQVQAADGSCVAAPKAKVDPKAGPKADPKAGPKGPVKTTPSMSAGTSIPVTVGETLNSDTVAVGQYVNGTVNAPIVFNGKTVVPEGTKVVLQVKGVDQSGKVLGAAKIDLALVEMTVGGKKYSVAGAKAIVKGPSKTGQTAKDAGILAGIGAGVGCGIGKVIHHTAAGCATGVAAGGGTGVLISSKDKPKPATLKPGEVVSFKLGQPVNLA